MLYLYVVAAAAVAPARREALAADRTPRSKTVPQIEPVVGSDMSSDEIARIVRAASDGANARVTLLRVGRVGGEPAPDTITDSSEPGLPVLELPAGRRGGRAAAASRPARRSAADGPVAEVARAAARRATRRRGRRLLDADGRRRAQRRARPQRRS